MKKKLALILAAAMTVSSVGITAVAEEEYPEVTVIIDGKEIESDTPAVIVDGRTLVPMRAVGEALDVTVDWYGETKTVVFTKDGLTASMVIGENTLNISDGENSIPVEIDTPATIINSRTMIPIRFISENFKAQVDWNADTKTVTITSENAVNEETESQGETSGDEPIDQYALNAAMALIAEGNAGASVLNKYMDNMTEEQSEAYLKYCDAFGGAGVVLESASQAYTNEDLANITESLNEALAGFSSLAEELGVSDEYEEALNISDEEEAAATDAEEESSPITADDVKDLLNKVNSINNTLQSVDMDSEQTDIYNGFLSSLQTVEASVDKLETEKDCMDAIDILTSVEKGFDNLAEELGIPFSELVG